MSITANILVFSADAKIAEEANLAFNALPQTSARYRIVENTTALFEALRNRPVSLVLAEFPEDPRELLEWVRQIQSVSPKTKIAAILPQEGFSEQNNESALLIDAMRCGVCDFLKRPFSTADLQRLIQIDADNQTTAAQAGSPGAGRVVSFISNKGGVGKSTLATNTGVAIARRGQQSVLLIDGSIQMGVAAALLDLQPEATLTDVAREVDRLDPTMIRQTAAVHSSGLHLIAAPADAVEAMEIDDLLMARILTVARQTYDVVIVDTFPMFDRVVIAALDLSDRVYVVLENVVPTLLGGVKLLSVLDRIGYPAARQSIVLNRQQRVTGSLSVDDVADRMGRDIDHVLPFDKKVVAAANCGVPIAMAPIRLGGFSRALAGLADDVAGTVDSTASRVEMNESSLLAPDESPLEATSLEDNQ